MQAIVYLVITDAIERAEMERALRDAHVQYRTFSSAQALLDAAPQASHACVVGDLRGDMHGLDLLRELRSRQLQWPMLLVTDSDEMISLFYAVKNGDVSILDRPISSDGLIDGITDLLEAQRRRMEEESELKLIESRIARLTQRESEVTMRVLEGLSNKQISNELGISVRTVEKHRAAVMNKLGATNVAELCRMRRHCERMFESFSKQTRKFR